MRITDAPKNKRKKVQVVLIQDEVGKESIYKTIPGEEKKKKNSNNCFNHENAEHKSCNETRVSSINAKTSLEELSKNFFFSWMESKCKRLDSSSCENPRTLQDGMELQSADQTVRLQNGYLNTASMVVN